MASAPSPTTVVQPGPGWVASSPDPRNALGARPDPDSDLPVLLRALRAADPFVIKRSQLRESGTSLGGCLRLVMIPLFIAYGLVVIIQYQDSPNVETSTLVPSSASTSTYIQQVTSPSTTVITVQLVNPDSLTPCTLAPRTPPGTLSARTSGPVCPSRRGPVSGDGTASQGGVGWAFIVREPPEGFTQEQLRQPMVVFSAVDGNTLPPSGMVHMDPATYVPPPGSIPVSLGTIKRYGSPQAVVLAMAVSQLVSNVGSVESGYSVLLEDFVQPVVASLGGRGCFGPNTECRWEEDVLAPNGTGCGLMNETLSGGGAYLRCRGGNFTIGPNDIWGVSLVQTQEFTVVTTISSSRRGLLSILGSIGGAYSIVFTVCAIVYKCMWTIRASKGWTPEHDVAMSAALQASGEAPSVWRHVRHSVFGLHPPRLDLLASRARGKGQGLLQGGQKPGDSDPDPGPGREGATHPNPLLGALARAQR